MKWFSKSRFSLGSIIAILLIFGSTVYVGATDTPTDYGEGSSYVVDTVSVSSNMKISGTSKKSTIASHVRFIKDRYFDTLLPNSKWRSEPLQSSLLNVLNNDLKDTSSCVQVWEFSADDFEDILKWCKDRENSSQTNKEFIRAFYDEHCVVDNTYK